jgi:hypothetical protein
VGLERPALTDLNVGLYTTSNTLQPRGSVSGRSDGISRRSVDDGRRGHIQYGSGDFTVRSSSIRTAVSRGTLIATGAAS